MTRTRTSLLLAGLAAAGLALGAGATLLSLGRGPLVPVLVVGAVVTAVAVVARPLWGCALVLATSSIGNRELPGAPLGLQLVHITTSLAVGSVLLALLTRRLPWPHLTPRVARAVLAAAGVVLAALLATATSEGLLRSLKIDATLTAGFLLVLLVVVCVRTRDDLLLLCGAFVAGSIPVSVQGIAAVGSVRSVYDAAVVEGRPAGEFTEPNAMGLFCAIAFFVSLGLWCWCREPWWRALAGVAGVAAGLALTASLSRGAWLGTGLGLAAFAVLHPRVVPTLLRVGAGAAATLTVALGLGLASGPLSVVGSRLGTVIGGQESPYDVRPLTWAEAVRQITDRPLLGSGPGSFAELSAEWPSPIQFYPRLHAHNGLLTTAAEMGLVGAAAVLLLVATTTMAALRSPGRGAMRVALLCALVAVGGHLLVDYPLRNPVLMLTIWAVQGLLLATILLESHSRSPSTGGTPVRAVVRVGSEAAPEART